MRDLLRRLLLTWAIFSPGAILLAQTPPLELREVQANFNPLFKSGPPEAPGTASQGQFSSVVSFSGGSFPPRRNGTLQLTTVRLGAPYFSELSAFEFGAIIPVPDTKADGSAFATSESKEDYWVPEPYSTNDHANARYYWSPHKGAVFATQSGPVDITWRAASGSATKPDDYDSDPQKYALSGGIYYPLLKLLHRVSSSPVKPSRKIYWTEGAFSDLGKAVTVPSTRIRRINVVYNSNFPEHTSTRYYSIGETPISSSDINYRRTLYYDGRFIQAYNAEGRAFVELLGDGPDDQREHLGFEIVDVIQQPSPVDLDVELGDRLLAFPDGQDDSFLVPEPLTPALPYLYSYTTPNPDVYHAIRETHNLNDVLVHWMEEGEMGLLWPNRFARYRQAWPTDSSRYSHYLRPAALTASEAEATGVKLPPSLDPTIVYQDPFDFERASITPESKFYTLLDDTVPAHRTLLLFKSGAYIQFERVFSWLDTALKSNQDRVDNPSSSTQSAFENSVATSLSVWTPSSGTLRWRNAIFSGPRVVTETVEVGQRISAPERESGTAAGESYLAGHIRSELGDDYYPQAYVDPLESTSDLANAGAIIPVNARPNHNHLEVWWFRRNDPDLARGFKTLLWPSVIGRYTVQWPANPSEIVLASNDGSGGLPSLEAKGSIYVQNDPHLPGYNPNEEHALMLGGQAYALRDDLNILEGDAYSSAPYVLLAYTESDGRPAMHPFKVLREKPEAGIVFDYLVEAGTMLQAPMPLPLLPPPTDEDQITVNHESPQSNDLPLGWTDQDLEGPYKDYPRFTIKDRKNAVWVYRAAHAGPPELAAGTYRQGTESIGAPVPATAVVGEEFEYVFHATRLSQSLTLQATPGTTLPEWLQIQGLALRGTPTAVQSPTPIRLRVTATDDGSITDFTLPLRVVASGTPSRQGPISIVSFNPFSHADVTYVDRPPYLATSPTSSDSFTMRFYYRTREGFAWPGLDSPPPVDSVVPYLRPLDAGSYVGEPDKPETQSLDIVYRPYWPYTDDNLPKMDLSDTLTLPKNNLPAVRGQSSARVLYQQSIALDIRGAPKSVVLHDPTREKSSAYGLDKLPSSVTTYLYQGRTYFPKLPPHLAQRVFFDPNRGDHGHLVFQGQFKDSYLLLNVLSSDDLVALKALCADSDSNKASWDSLVENLSTVLQTFEDPDLDGVFTHQSTKDVAIAATELAEIAEDGDDIAVDSYALSASGPGTGYVSLIFGDGKAFTPEADPISIRILRVQPRLYLGEVKVIAAANPLSEAITFQHTPDLAARFEDFEYDWRIGPPVDGEPPPISTFMEGWTSLARGINQPRYTLGGSGIQTLGDNYIVVRYRPKDPAHPLFDQWSDWTQPQLAEGWIKRVLAGINPFNQRATDLFNNRVNTDVSLLTQAGPRWEGDIALNLESINSFGLIEIYETVLRRGKSLSIDSGINFGPANDALLLAAGYLNDLYMIVGNEAWADAANPTIGIGIKDRTYGDIATALFAFKGQVPSLLEEELALLRGRDDFLQPGVSTAPVYNRMVWNYTRGIDSGEVIYAVNYNIQENPDGASDGIVDANDAKVMFPQGHGDAYGHYLTALKGYYSLLLDNDFDWVPRTEAVLILDKPVQVDYLDERKFAAAAAAVARTGRQIVDLTWRRDYQSGDDKGWEHLSPRRTNENQGTTRNWGVDHWASRTALGAYVHWVVGNAILPDVDPDPEHEGIQKIDRTTVPELRELTTLLSGVQDSLDQAEGHQSPLGIPDGSLAFDINPNQVVGTQPATHFEQVYERAKGTLANALSAFDDAKDVTRLMRSEQDSQAELQAQITRQELAYQNALIEIYGTPYTDDIGPGKTYAQGYAGPDLIHYTYVDMPELVFPGLWNYTEIIQTNQFTIDLQDYPSGWLETLDTSLNYLKEDSAGYDDLVASEPTKNKTFKYTLSAHGFAEKPIDWTGRRSSPGKVQQAISEFISSHRRLKLAFLAHEGGKTTFDSHLRLFEQQAESLRHINDLSKDILDLENEIAALDSRNQGVSKDLGTAIEVADMVKDAALDGVPDELKDAFSPEIKIKLAIHGVASAAKTALFAADAGAFRAFRDDVSQKQDDILSKAKFIANTELKQTLRDTVYELLQEFEELQAALDGINFALRDFDDANRKIRSLIAEGDRIQAERETFRRQNAGVVQGFRTRDAAFRAFRNEKLERYKSLFDVAARYAFLAANAYDYETGLLHTTKGQEFLSRIIQSRALGVLRNGEPQFAGSNTGDPGLSSAMAEMKADWDVLKGRLGFNNPDAYGTSVSLRTENWRILPGIDGDSNWRQILSESRRDNLLSDPDVVRHCLQIDRGDGLPVPGILIEFSTTISDGLNLFGRPLAAFDHAFSSSSFATKIFSVGVAMEGYQGMDNPAANASAVAAAGGTSPPAPSLAFLDSTALAATPYVYLIPVGVDSMRSPPLGDTSEIRTWSVNDVAIPLPFNIGASDFSSKRLYQSSESLSEPLFDVRKHQAFRPVSSASLFSQDIYGSGNGLALSQFTNRRLIGRSAWNSKWKLVIPGRSLLNDPNEGLDRFTKSVSDIKLHFVTYSYSGN